MRAISQSISTYSPFAKITEWVKLVAITGLAQAFIQAIGLISGIIVIRLLPTHEYALYILANTMLGTMTILADGGIAVGVMAQGGKVWQDRKKLGSVLTTGFELRRKFAVVSLAVAVPLLLLLLRHHGADWLPSLLIVFSLVPAFYAFLSGTLLEVAHKLHQDIFPLQKLQIEANIGRLVLIGLTLFIFPWAFITLLTSGIPQIIVNRRLRKIAYDYAEPDQKSDPVVRTQILSMVRRRLPDAVYYCASSQITIWIISIVGSTTAVAQAGALGRLVVVINLLNVLFCSLILPRFARLVDNSNLLLKRYAQIQIGVIALSIGIVGVVWLFSSEILWVLGENYGTLTNEIVLAITGSCLGFVGVTSNFLCTSRGWVINPFLSIAINVAAVALGATLINLSSLTGIFLLNILVASAQTLMWMTYAVTKILRMK